MAAGRIAEAAAKLAKPAAVAAVGYVAKKFGDRVANEAYDKARDKQRSSGENKRQERLAQDLARARSWTYLQHVVDAEQRWVVFNEHKRPVAAFPPVEGANTPEALQGRVELEGFVPTDAQLKAPPAAHG